MSRHDRHRRRRHRRLLAHASAIAARDLTAWRTDSFRRALAQAVVADLAGHDDERVSRLFGRAAARGVA